MFVTASLFFREFVHFESSVCVIFSPVRSYYAESSFKLLSWRTNRDVIVHISTASEAQAEQIRRGAASDAMYLATSFCREHVKIICFQCSVLADMSVCRSA